MIRQPQQEQINRLSVKTLDQVFVARAQEGLSCSLFEAQALEVGRRLSAPARSCAAFSHFVQFLMDEIHMAQFVLTAESLD